MRQLFIQITDVIGALSQSVGTAGEMRGARNNNHLLRSWRQLLEERQDIATLQLSANNHLSASVNAVNLENQLGDV
jgi:hypothetical protein